MITNSAYDCAVKEISTTVLTAVYNRKDLLSRAMKSVMGQNTRSFEYVIVNDGSTEDLDGTVEEFMKEADFPVAYIKFARNRGVHAARNAGIRAARGKFTLFLDSDDEMKPNAIERFLEAWEEIPEEDRESYREVTGRCEDQNGNLVGKPYPEGINSLPFAEAYKKNVEAGGEHWGFMRTDTLKSCPWPEAEGVKFINESLVWEQLRQNYKSWYISDQLRIYHTEVADSITASKKAKSFQRMADERYEMCLRMNTPVLRTKNRKLYIKRMAKIAVYGIVLKRNKNENWTTAPIKLNRTADKLMYGLMYVPCYAMTLIKKAY